MRIDQILSSYVFGDAISAHAAHICVHLRNRGIESDIYSVHVGVAGPEEPEGKLAEQLDDGADVVIYHLSVGSTVLNRFAVHPGRRIVDYHNITPARYFEGWDPPTAQQAASGRRDLVRAARLCDFAFADSAFNQAELEEAGYPRTAVLPILIASRPVASDPILDSDLALRRKSGKIWLFVGRFVPHKCQTDVVRAFAAYRRTTDPGATLLLIGSPYTQSYWDAVEELAGRLGVMEAVILRGPVSTAELESYYRHADVLVCLSEHEGFCVPVIEAMAHHVPVVAYGAGAIPETAGEGGVVVYDKDPTFVAAVVAEVLCDTGLRNQLVARGAVQARAMSAGSQIGRLDSLLEQVTR